VKNESHFSTEKNTSFYSEFNADSEYVILFEKYRGQKNGLMDTCPFLSFFCIELTVKRRNKNR